MKILPLSLVFLSATAFGSSLTATITDSDSQTWNNGTWTMVIYSPNGTPTVNGVPLTAAQRSLSGTLSSSGVLSATVTDTSTIAPSGALWTFTICPNATSGCFTANLGVTGTSPDLSSTLSALAKGPRYPAGPAAYGYLDVEVVTTPAPGGTYYNVTNQVQRIWNGSAWANSGGGGGTGTVTSVSVTPANGVSGTVATPNTTPAITLTVGPTPISGALADYVFTAGTGTTVTDITGNGNTATLGTGGAAPVWVPNGLSFVNQENVALPSAINSAKTYFLGFYLTPITDDTSVAPIFSNQIPALVSSSLDFSGVNLLYWRFSGTFGTNAYGASGIYSPSIGSNGNRTSSVTNLMSGFHVLTYVLGTGSGSVDHIYIDGIEGTYALQGSSAGFQTSGNLFIGSSGSASFTGSGFFGTMYRFAALTPNNLTAAQINAISTQIKDEVGKRGVDVNPKPIQQQVPRLYAIGDSITCGFSGSVCNGVTPWPSSLSLTNQPSYSIWNTGIPGITQRAIIGSEANRVAPQCSTISGPSVAVVFLGTNDIFDFRDQGGTGAASAASTLATGASEVQILKNAGCIVFLGTMISRGGNDPFGTSMDTDKDTYDALILTNYKTIGADGVMDFAANPLLGADGANANATYFQSDLTHPTTTGQGLLAAAASNALNYYFGSTQANPHVVTTTPYTMVAGDGYITANPTANQALTLPDCTGQSGATYTIGNIQSAFTIGVVTGSSSQLINGLSAGTSVTIPSNSSVAFKDVANSKTVSGCHWEK